MAGQQQQFGETVTERTLEGHVSDLPRGEEKPKGRENQDRGCFIGRPLGIGTKETSAK